MDQQKIGLFIASLRKEKNLTQAQLGERLGVTNKTVSRWERGNYLPDISLMPVLCHELAITINELLNGERLNDEDFRQIADEQLTASLSREEKLRRRPSVISFLEGGGTGLLIASLWQPDSLRRNITIAIAIIMILAGWLWHDVWEKRLLKDATSLEQKPAVK